MRKYLPQPDLFIGQAVDRFPHHRIEELIDKGSNALLFRAYNPLTESNLAYKVIPFANLRQGGENLEEVFSEAKQANILRHASVVRVVDVVRYAGANDDQNCVILICEFVDGMSLRKYMKSRRAEIGIPFVEAFLTTMFELLYEFHQRNVSHGDLHAGNILVGSSEYDIYNRPTFRITDFRVKALTGPLEHENDYLQVAGILRELLLGIDYQQCEGRDRYVFNALKSEFLDRHLIEEDVTVDLLAQNPSGLMDKLTVLDDRYRKETSTPAVSLLTPFDYPNCEQIGNSHLLLQTLYSDRLLGLAAIERRSNMVLTGPRGCGKTTVFRALSLDYLVSTDTDQPASVPYIGIYYRCDDIYFSFPRYKAPMRLEGIDVPMHFVAVTLLAQLLEQLAIWGKRHFQVEFDRKEELVVSKLWELLGWTMPKDPSGGRIATLVARLSSKERRRAANKQRFVSVETEPIDGYFGPGVLFSACELIRASFSFTENRPIYFFIDDYSVPKITKDLQINLNRLLLHRSPDVFFKISTESPVSFVREDIDGKRFVESREYELVNLGLQYITSEAAHIQKFLEDLFDRRFQKVENYPVSTLQELLGSLPRNENDTARQFRKNEAKENYAGIETVTAMCSGDIHYMIRLVSIMVEDFGGVDSLRRYPSSPRIPPRRQHDSIRRAAGSFVESVRTLPRCGPQLAQVVSAFGNVAHSYLRYETSANEKGSPPHQASRIEPYEPLQLSDDAKEILEELLRYSILIEDPRGKSRRREIVPRFYLRRYLVPHFQLTFSRRDSLELENDEIELLFSDPSGFERAKRIKSTDEARRRKRGRSRGKAHQGELFDDT